MKAISLSAMFKLKQNAIRHLQPMSMFYGDCISSKYSIIWTSIIQTINYLNSSVDCSIRVFCHSVHSIRTMMNHPNTFYLSNFVIQLAQRCSDNGDPTVVRV